MKISLVLLVLLLCITQGFASEGSKKRTSGTIKRPPYHTDSTPTYYHVDKDLRRKLNTIFNQISRYTCLEFKYKDEPISNSIGINFEKSSTGKNTVVLSDSPNSPTNVSLIDEAYDSYKNLSFYVGLALNITPEISRHDRDEDVDVINTNIEESYKNYYTIVEEKYTSYLEGTEFDFGSPMFFDPYFGSKDKINPTYKVKMYKDYQPFYGDGKIFRHNDYKHMFNYYCGTSQTTIECKNGGYYPGTSEFTKGPKCKCPNYFSGTTCADLEKDEDNKCKEEQRKLTADEKEKLLKVENNDGRCHYNITSDDGKKKVKVNIKKVHFGKTNCDNGNVYLEVLFRNDKGAKGIFLCRTKENIDLPALSSEVIVVFYGTKSSGDNSLEISYQAVPEKN